MAFPGVQDGLNRAPVLRPRSLRLGLLLYRGSSRGACTRVRGRASPDSRPVAGAGMEAQAS